MKCKTCATGTKGGYCTLSRAFEHTCRKHNFNSYEESKETFKKTEYLSFDPSPEVIELNINEARRNDPIVNNWLTFYDRGEISKDYAMMGIINHLIADRNILRKQLIDEMQRRPRA